MNQNLDEKLLSCETLFDGHVVHLERWTVELPNGRQATREIIRHVGASAVLAVNDRGEACMVRQYRAALGRVTLEIPAGKLEQKGGDPLESAIRELSEETGLSADNWTHLTKIHTSVGFCDEEIDLYLATSLSQGAQHPDDDEFVEVLFLPVDELLDMARSGAITDCKSVCALLLAKPLLENLTIR